MRCAAVGGERGAKRPDQGEFVPTNQVPDTVPGSESIWTTLNGHEARNRGHGQETVPTSIPNACEMRWNGYGRQSVCASTPEVGAQCGNSARWDLCGGRRVTGVPTANDHFEYMIGRFLTGRTNHLDVASACLTSAGTSEINDSPSRVNPAAPKCPHQFRENGGLFCCPVFDEFRGQNRGRVVRGLSRISLEVGRTSPNLTTTTRQ